MKNDEAYTDAPDDVQEALLSARRIDDFLPSPELLVPKEETKKVGALFGALASVLIANSLNPTEFILEEMMKKSGESWNCPSCGYQNTSFDKEVCFRCKAERVRNAKI